VSENRTTRTSKPLRGLSRLVRNLLLVGAAVLASLLLCELLLRLLGVSYPVFVWMDPVRGVVHIPGAKSARLYQGHSWIEINSDGMRGPDVALKPPPGTFRIALLGDSFIEAFEVPFEKTVGEVLARRLTALRGAPVEVLNFGQGGYGTTQQLLTLKHQVWKYSPDLVLLAITTGNDISDNSRVLKGIDYIPYYVYRGSDLVLDTSFLQAKGYQSRALWTRRWLGVVQHSRLAQLVNRVRHLQRRGERQREMAAGATGGEPGLRDEVHLPPTTPEWQEAWRVTEGILRLMRDECRRKHTPLAIVTLTRGIQVIPQREKKEKFLRQLGAKDLYYAERRLNELGKREGIPVFNLAPVMARQAEERQVFFHAHQDSLGIGHWSEEGHRVAGELIASWLAGDLAGRSTRASRR
jgi:lysophospholipase L1-like esterase